MKQPVVEITRDFERETGIRVRTHFDGSSILREFVRTHHTGDLFLPGDKDNLEALSVEGFVEDSAFVAWHVVAILVAPHQVGRISCLDDMAASGVRLAISNPRLASLGRIVTEQIIKRHPKGKGILDNIVVYGSSSLDTLGLCRRGGIDAILEWDVMAATPEGHGLTVVPLGEPYAAKDELHVGLLRTATDPTRARRLYRYITTEGKEVFRRNGYATNAW